MGFNVRRKAIINTLEATGNNLLDDTAGTQFMVGADNTVDPFVDFLPPFQKGTISAVNFVDAVTEIVQIVLAGKNITNDQLETIVASQQYTIKTDDFFETYEGFDKSDRTYSTTAPANLTGDADLDRANVYTVLNTKINADNGNNLTSFLVQEVPYDTGTTAAPVVGSTITEAVTGTTAIIVDTVITSGTFAGSDALGFFYVHSATAIFDATNDYTYTGGTAAATTIGIASQALALVDDAGYNQSQGTPGSLTPDETPIRNGATNVFLVAQRQGTGAPSFTVGEAEITRAAVFQEGSGAVLLKELPVYNRDVSDRISGDADLIFGSGQLPDAAKTYSLAVIDIDTNLIISGLTNNAQRGCATYLLYMDDSDGTNLTNLKNALTGMV